MSWQQKYQNEQYVHFVINRPQFHFCIFFIKT